MPTVITVFRPEIRDPQDGATEDYEAWLADPHEGYEIFAVLYRKPDEEMYDFLQGIAEKHPGWKFSIEESLAISWLGLTEKYV